MPGSRLTRKHRHCNTAPSGDTSAFEGVVRRWQGPLVNLAYRFCRDRGRAEEMAYRDHLVRRAVQTLPARYREALTLFYFDDMNVA